MGTVEDRIVNKNYEMFLDIERSSPVAMDGRRMDNETARILAARLLTMNPFDMSVWENDFVRDVQGRDWYSEKQKRVIYKLAFRFRLLQP